MIPGAVFRLGWPRGRYGPITRRPPMNTELQPTDTKVLKGVVGSGVGLRIPPLLRDAPGPRVPGMGRIVAEVTVSNPSEPQHEIRFDALVDTGTGLLVLPRAWKGRLGSLAESQPVQMETADQRTVTGDVCGPVRIAISGFRPIFSEVAFLDMHPADGTYEPLLGYIALEQAGVAVDMLGHRLVEAKRMDLKRSV